MLDLISEIKRLMNMHDILSILKIVLRKFLKVPGTALPLRVLFFERFGDFVKTLI